MTFLKQIAEVRRQCPNILHRRLLSDAHEEIVGRLHILNADPTTKNMQALVGAWTRAAVLMERVNQNNGGGGGARKRKAA